MAKKKRKKKKSKVASSVLDLVAGDGPPPLPKTTKPKPKPTEKYKATCGLCSKANQVVAYTECDDGWEYPDHPDHINRDVCVSCAPGARERDRCAGLVFAAMTRQLEAKDFSKREIENAVHIAWRTFSVDLDDNALVKMARKLKVKHPWLKGKKAK